MPLPPVRFSWTRLPPIAGVPDTHSAYPTCNFFHLGQVEAIKDIAEYVAMIKRVGTGHGVFDLDRQLEEKLAQA